MSTLKTGPQIVAMSNLLKIIKDYSDADYAFSDIDSGYYPFTITESGRAILNNSLALTKADFGLSKVENNYTKDFISSKSQREWISTQGLYNFANNSVTFKAQHVTVYLKNIYEGEAPIFGYNSFYYLEADSGYYLPHKSGITVEPSAAIENIQYIRSDDYISGYLFFTMPNQNATLNIIGVEAKDTFTIQANITNGTYTGHSYIMLLEEVHCKITPEAGCFLPTSISVTGAEYIFNASTGDLTLFNPVSNVTIIAKCTDEISANVSINAKTGVVTYNGCDPTIYPGMVVITKDGGWKSSNIGKATAYCSWAGGFKEFESISVGGYTFYNTGGQSYYHHDYSYGDTYYAFFDTTNYLTNTDVLKIKWNGPTGEYDRTGSTISFNPATSKYDYLKEVWEDYHFTSITWASTYTISGVEYELKDSSMQGQTEVIYKKKI